MMTKLSKTAKVRVNLRALTNDVSRPSRMVYVVICYFRR
jgi:hypothetical protein